MIRRAKVLSVSVVIELPLLLNIDNHYGRLLDCQPDERQFSIAAEMAHVRTRQQILEADLQSRVWEPAAEALNMPRSAYPVRTQAAPTSGRRQACRKIRSMLS